MILLDSNLLVYAYASALPQHQAAREWLDSRLGGPARVGLPWASLTSFMRLAMNSRVFQKAVSAAEVWRQVEAWLDCPVVWVPEPGPDHRKVLGALLPNLGGGHKLIPDAHLAALAIEHGLTLCSADGDFARFPGLRWENPLASGR